MKTYCALIVLITVLLSCGKDRTDSEIIGLEPGGTRLVDPAEVEMRIDSSIQQVSLFRVRKANGANRMRLLVDMPDSVRFTLFVTPFSIGTQQIESGNVQDQALKYSRTHSEFRQLVDASQFYFYEVDTALAFDNRVEIFHIDSVQRTVAGRFQCRMKIMSYAGIPRSENILIQGGFNSTYRD